jgi:hypothetical protein
MLIMLNSLNSLLKLTASKLKARDATNFTNKHELTKLTIKI